MNLDRERGMTLLAIARAAIEESLNGPMDSQPPDEWLREQGACFVTLTIRGALRGCIGTINPHRSIFDDVRANARAATFRDPRFPPLTSAELGQLEIEVSVLSPLERLYVQSEAEARARITPFVDGVVIKHGSFRGTFLPQVWERFTSPEEFLKQLKQKAGLTESFWSRDIELFRFTVTSFFEDLSDKKAAHG